MFTFSKNVLVISTILCAVAVIWYLLGSTAIFQRQLDLVSTFTFMYIWIPALILVIFSSILLIKGWIPSNKVIYVVLWSLILALLFFTVSLFKMVGTLEWMHDNIISDPIKITSDGKYEYRFELVNLFQKNSRERLYVRNVSTGDEVYISINLNTSDFHGVVNMMGNDWAWAVLTPTEVPNQYELTTTELLSLNQKRVLVDISAGHQLD